MCGDENVGEFEAENFREFGVESFREFGVLADGRDPEGGALV
jgi:hypothetical protein